MFSYESSKSALHKKSNQNTFSQCMIVLPQDELEAKKKGLAKGLA